MVESDLSEQMVPSRVVLENGEILMGLSPKYDAGTHYGEIVFTTGMTGYIESLTDPSYKGQMLCFTYPLIGNYGVGSQEHWESKKIHASGVIIGEACQRWSHASGVHSFMEWLHSQGVPLVCGVDTRALTKVLRVSGTMLGALTTENKKMFSFHNPHEEHLVSQVSTKEKITYNGSSKKKVVFAIDCGMKENIARCLEKLPVTVHRVPYDYDFTNEHYDGVFLSNGPGDPTKVPETVEIVRKALKKEKPIFGICLGLQVLSLAAGGSTYKLPFGHRGHNQPCIDTVSRRCYITSQNHGYAVDESSLPSGWQVTFRNLNDQSVAGIAHKKKPFFAVQFHPEAMPGPTDTQWLFDKFYQML